MIFPILSHSVRRFWQDGLTKIEEAYAQDIQTNPFNVHKSPSPPLGSMNNEHNIQNERNEYVCQSQTQRGQNHAK